MGELKESFQSNEVLVTLKGLHCFRKLQRLSVHAKEKLTSMVKAAVLSEEDKTFIKDRNISIAQKDNSSSEVSPDLLIGQDLLNTIIDQKAAVLKLPSGLMLSPTIFGYTISGTSQIILSIDREDIHFSTLVVATPIASAKDDYKKDIKHLYELESLGLNISNDSHEAAMIKFMNT
ncbi:hypothetical protein Y032_0028g1768 [Ancylostoma ceylanicum]|nr:hypothetical protein Y032_0028g1768 [Ancylostoma ceylanicum]